MPTPGMAGIGLSTPRRPHLYVVGACALSLLVWAPSLRAQDPVSVEIKQAVEWMRAQGSIDAGGVRLADASLPTVYEGNGFQPFWPPGRLARLLDALDGLAADGLRPEAYQLPLLRARFAAPGDPAAQARTDLLATAMFARARDDLRLGRVPDGGRESSGIQQTPEPGRGGLDEALSEPDPITVLGDARPRHFVYRGLMEALASYRRIATRGGWPSVPPGPPLARDSVDGRVPMLRRRLVVSGDLAPGSDTTAARVDATLEQAVRAFQHRHGLNPDGVVGLHTLAALNVPVDQRIEALRVNLERARWVAPGLPARLLAVNVAGARAYLLEGDSVAFETRVVVGRTQTRTPVFRATLRYVDLNPTWTVPPGIVQEILDLIADDPDYLARSRTQVLDRAGRRVGPSTVDFSAYNAGNFPYVFRQAPGPTNPLGALKLVFPNPYHVFLHDTPSGHLFSREIRTFSHGCIRVQDVMELTARVLGDPAWTRSRLESEAASGQTRTIPLREPLPVLILYWTAAVDLHGELHFYPDVYGRDPALSAALGPG